MSIKNLCKSNDKNNNGKIQKIIRSTKTSSPTNEAAATNLSPVVNIFMYIETSSGNHSDGAFNSFERTEIIRIISITLH